MLFTEILEINGRQANSFPPKDMFPVIPMDEKMRNRLAELNPEASLKVANRLLEAHERDYWQPDEDTLEALRQGADELEDRLEGINVAAE